MTDPILPGPSFRAAQIEEAAKTLSLSQNSFVLDRRLTVCSSIATAASHRHEESRLIYGLLASILLDQGSPVEYKLDEFNTPHTGTTFNRLQYWLCRLRYKFCSDTKLLHLWATFSGDIHVSPRNNQNHKLTVTTTLSVLKQQT